MYNLCAGEIVVIVVAALLLLGPKRLPEVARGIGKFMREFRRQTDDVRTVVEREFYRMDQELNAPVDTPPAERPAAALPSVQPVQPVPPQLTEPLDPSTARTQPLEPVILPAVPGTVAKPRAFSAPPPAAPAPAAAEPSAAPASPESPSRQE